MKKAVSVCITVMLTAIILLYAQVQSFVPAQGKGEEISLVAGDHTEEKNRIGNAGCGAVPQIPTGAAQENAEDAKANIGEAEAAQGNEGETREENTYALSEEERKILQAYADYIPQLREEITRSTELMKFDLIYIDGDDIPELALIEADANSTDTVRIYAYYDGRVELAGFAGSFGTCRFKPYANLILDADAYEGQQGESFFFYRLLQAEMVRQQSFYHRPQYQAGDIFLLDDRRVSEEEYQEAWASWDVDELDSWGYDDAAFVEDYDDLYGELCRRHAETLERGGAARHSTDVTIGWRRQYLEYSEETDVPLPDDLWEADGLTVRIHGCAPDLSFLEDMERLTELEVAFDSEADLSYLGCLDGLERLSLYPWYGDTVELSFLKELDQLTEIYADRICDIEDLSFFQHMVHLKSLSLSYVDDVDLNYLMELTELETLEISGGNIRNLEGLAGMAQLESLYLCETHLIRDNDRPVLDLSPLGNLSDLERISLLFISTDDLHPLSVLRKLDSIWLVDTDVEDISVLRDMENLSDLSIHGNTSEQVKEQAETYFSDLDYVNVTEEWPPGI